MHISYIYMATGTPMIYLIMYTCQQLMRVWKTDSPLVLVGVVTNRQPTNINFKHFGCAPSGQGLIVAAKARLRRAEGQNFQGRSAPRAFCWLLLLHMLALIGHVLKRCGRRSFFWGKGSWTIGAAAWRQSRSSMWCGNNGRSRLLRAAGVGK